MQLTFASKKLSILAGTNGQKAGRKQLPLMSMQLWIFWSRCPSQSHCQWHGRVSNPASRDKPVGQTTVTWPGPPSRLRSASRLVTEPRTRSLIGASEARVRILPLPSSGHVTRTTRTPRHRILTFANKKLSTVLAHFDKRTLNEDAGSTFVPAGLIELSESRSRNVQLESHTMFCTVPWR